MREGSWHVAFNSDIIVLGGFVATPEEAEKVIAALKGWAPLLPEELAPAACEAEAVPVHIDDEHSPAADDPQASGEGQ